MATVSVSVALFGLYILAFYAGALLDGELEGWNEVLPRLYKPIIFAATVSIALHFAAGGVILVLGCVQLLGGIRARFPALHRWLGRVYMVASLLAGVGGLTFIALKGTVGSTVIEHALSVDLQPLGELGATQPRVGLQQFEDGQDAGGRMARRARSKACLPVGRSIAYL